MRKLLFFILLLPAIVSLGHDVYIYTQDQSKGFRFSDVGALWDKYHKESHDQWKNKLHEAEDIIGELSPVQLGVTPVAKNQELPAEYIKGFSQNDGEDVVSLVKQSSARDLDKDPASGLQKNIGFILEQKAVFVFGALAAIVFIINFILGLLFKEKTSMDKVDELKRNIKGKKGGKPPKHLKKLKKGKKGKYSYGRK